MAEKKVLDLLYEACPRFDESEMAQTREHRALIKRMLDLEQRVYMEENGDAFEQYQDCASCDEECERRHYFASGFRMGLEAGSGAISSGLEGMGTPER